MNILLVNQQGNSVVSGVASHFENITKTLLDMGHNVERLIAENKRPPLENKMVKSHTFKYIDPDPNQTIAWRKRRLLKNREYFEVALKKTAWKKIDLVIASNDIRIPILVKYFDRKKIIPIIPSSLAFSPICNPEGYSKVLRRLEKNLVGVHAVVLSGKMKKMLLGLLDNKNDISVIYPGVDLKNFSAATPRKKSDEILYIGRIAEEKNIQALIEAVSQIKHSGHLVIVGGGKDLSKIKKLAKQKLSGKKFTFTGRRRRVAKYYSAARLFILPSRYEAFGLVILEAMASGLPVIAFRPSRKILTASDEIISDGSDGFLVRNTAEMAKKIDLLLKNDKLFRKMSKNAVAKAGRFTWQNHVNKLLKLQPKT
jgi:glycosyltransferase involved in cell wall biosynthesis